MEFDFCRGDSVANNHFSRIIKAKKFDRYFVRGELEYGTEHFGTVFVFVRELIIPAMRTVAIYASGYTILGLANGSGNNLATVEWKM